MVAAVCGLTSASAGEFLDGLAAREERVDSSPHATGGDVILKISDAEYVHVFTNVAPEGAYAFTPSVDLACRVLAVAGGGGGGTGYFSHGGGGGAGGMIDTNGVLFTQGVSYDVSVGAGGAKTTGNDNMRGGKGAASTVNGLQAVGGGGGGGFAARGGEANNGLAGGSGGGGGGGETAEAGAGGGGAGTPGQGFAGGRGYYGNNHNSAFSGGGGGAGGPGEDCSLYTSSTPIAGAGGVGRVTDILGYDQYFAGGGAGGAGSISTQALGGLGGGGKGSYSGQKNASDGEDGLGGGGGGAACNNSGYSGCGGSGIVAIRYWLPTEASVECLASGGRLALKRKVVFKLDCRNFVPDGGTVSVSFEIAPKSDPGAKTVYDVGSGLSAPNGFVVSFTNVVEGLEANVDYVTTWKVTNSGGASGELAAEYKMAYTCDPVVTGAEAGDYVVKHNVDGSDEVYIFTNIAKRAVFTPQSDGIVRLLLVGGGGAGLCQTPKTIAAAGGGGGGAGGVRYVGEYIVHKGVDYPVVVGAGAAVRTGWNRAPNGDNSSFGDLVALGGGSGGGNNQAGASGGSGGGGADSGGPGKSLDGQGHDGGRGTGDGMAGGGGGAGAPGVAASGTKAGDGGAGIAYDISGELVTYAGGGGGGTSGTAVNGAGGAGGGGAGASKTTAAQPGVNGLGGGGGGGNQGNNPERSFNAARGGSGVVIVRFTDISKLTKDPKFSSRVLTPAGSSVDVEVDVTSFGITSESASVSARIGYAPDALTESRILSENHTAKTVYTIDNLSPGRTYYLKIVVSNAEGGTSESTVYDIALPGGLNPDKLAVRTHEGFVYGFSITLSAVGSGTVLAKLYTGAKDELVACETLSVTTAGTYTLTHTYPGDLAETTVYAYVEVTETESGHTWTQRTPMDSFTMADNTSYLFSAADGVGDWFDPATWTATPEGVGAGYPGSESVVTFPNNACSEVRIGRSVKPGLLSLSGMTGATVVFKGTADGVSIRHVNPAKDQIVGAGSTCIVDHASIDFALTGWPKFTENQGFILRNGATYATPFGYGVELEYSGNNYLAVESGSTLSANCLWCIKTDLVRVDNATMSFGAFEARQSGLSGYARVEIAGTRPRFLCSSATTTWSDASVLFDPPEDPTAWTEAPFQVSGAFGGNGIWQISLPDKKTSKLRRSGRSRDIPLITAAGGITTNNIVFGAHPFRQGGFVFSEDLKTLYYRYVPGNGTVLFVR